MTPPYVELHCHSAYSFLDGASMPEELVTRAKELGYPALALTDHDGLYGSMHFAHYARNQGLRPITGAELTIEVDDEDWAASREDDDALLRPPASYNPEEAEGRPTFHLTLLAETPTGYANLCRLISEAHLGEAIAAYDRDARPYLGPAPGTTSEDPRDTAARHLAARNGASHNGTSRPAHSLPFRPERRDPRLRLSSLLGTDGEGGGRTEGLILLTGCRRSPLLRALEDSFATGEAFARRLLRAFGPGRLFVELQENQVRGDASRVRSLARLADHLGLPVVATGNVHYHAPRRHRLQDALVAIRHRTTLDGAHGLRRPNACFHMAPPEEMAHRFSTRPDALANTLRIAERCAAFDLTTDLGYSFPDFEGSERASAEETLARVCWARFEERYPPGSEHREEATRRLEGELALIERHRLSGFFLVYRDIMELATEVARRVRAELGRPYAGLPPGRGRGSSVSSVVCYLVGLSHVDPVENDLFLGRFLNDAMKSVPDIDLDFPREIREELILAVYEKYGYEHTGLVAIFPTYRFRSAVRELGKVLALPQGDLEKLSKLGGGWHSARALREELGQLSEFRDRADAPLWTLLAELGEEIAGLPRHISQHVGGMIISSRPLLEIVPLEPAAMEGRVLCQWDKDACDDARFIKIDFLALGMLSVVEDAVHLISEREGRAPDLTRIDYDDPEVYDRICDADTIGLFQIESRAQIQMLRRVRPRTLPDLAVQVAIVRPGPIVGGAVNPYVRRREMLREDPEYQVEYDHPLLEEALGETLGVIIFQDQVLKVCQAMADFTDGEAEGLRRAMSRRRSEELMATYWNRFRDGAMRNGVDEVTARTVFDQVQAFSQFGFPKSHAAAFALLAYQSAWLRNRYPVEYYVGLFNNQPMGFYSLDALGRDARRNGIEIRLPDVNQSGVECTAEESSLRVGLGFVRGWGREVAEVVVDERERNGPYRSLPDFLRRTPSSLKRAAIENLIWVGGFEELGLTRRELLWQVGLYLGPEGEDERTALRRNEAQLDLGMADPHGEARFSDLGRLDRMVAEYQMLRFSTEVHPLEAVRDQLPRSVVRSARFPDLPQRSTVTVAGIVVARQRPATAKGYIFILMEDEDGPINVIVKPKVYERCRSVVRMEPFLLVRGRLQKDGATMNVIAYTVEALRQGRGARNRSRVTPSPSDPFHYLGTLRKTPPATKSWG